MTRKMPGSRGIRGYAVSWDEEMRARFLRPEIGDGLRKANRYHHSIEIARTLTHDAAILLLLVRFGY